MNKMKIRIFAISSDGSEQYIDDLYWFEEQGVRDFGGKGLHGEPYKFRFELELTETVTVKFLVEDGLVSDFDLTSLLKNTV